LRTFDRNGTLAAVVVHCGVWRAFDVLKKEELDRICKLAKIRIDDQEFVEKLNSVFEWIDQLSKIDVSGVNLYDSGDIESTPERQDVALMTNTRDDILSNSKHKEFSMFSVPKVI
jgi:aspartyl/glutamyl-tRNA(Asn/Gln) amidotransferase C subunit